MSVKNKKIIDFKFVLKLSVITFFISIFFSCISEFTIPKANLFFSILITIIIIFVGIMFDMIGVAVAAADISPLNSMASKKIKGASFAIYLKKNASRVSSFCNDIVGDICGIISGTAGVVISNKIAENNFLVLLIITGVISMLTIGGKALLKEFALRRSDKILYSFAKILNFIYKR